MSIIKISALLFAICSTSFVFAALIPIQGRADFPNSWIKLEKNPSIQNDDVTFTFHLRQCNLARLEETFWEVSDPEHENYGKHLTLEAINELVSCDAADKPTLLNYLAQFKVDIKELGSTAVKVHTTIKVAEEILNTKFFQFYHEKTKKIIVRQMDAIYLPDELSVVDFISGVSEFFYDTKYEALVQSKQQKTDIKRRIAMRAGIDQQEYNPNIFPVTDQYVTPLLLQDVYGIPATPVQSAQSSLGIAAFDNDYDEEAFCRFQDLFNGYKAPPSMTQTGPQIGSDQVESDLDVQYSTAVATGIDAQFANHPNGEWILDWALQQVQNNERAYVWSISYGWPEVAQCTIIANNVTANGCPTGVNYSVYINRTNTELIKLGTLGVSVLVSAGDDGTPGFASNCPMNPNAPNFFGFFGSEQNCSMFVEGDCQCANALITYTNASGGIASCPYPVGPNYILDQTSPCAFLMDTFVEGLCVTALGEFLFQEVTENGHACNTSAEPFYSNCSCSVFKPFTAKAHNGSCTVSGYEFDIANGAAFFPDFPTSSPYVTSVGATALQYTSAQCQPSVNDPEIYCSTLDAAAYSGGGGFSSFQPSFTQQQAAINGYIKTASNLPPAAAFNPNNRGYPDVSFLGHNFMVAIGYTSVLEGEEPAGLSGLVMPVGGTSASSPSFAGLVARLNDYLLVNNKPTLGYLNPLLYQMAAADASTFNDIVPQTNVFLNATIVEGAVSNCTQEYCCQYGFEVAEGWDPATGLGTPNFPNMLSYISDMWAAKDSKTKPVSIN